MTTQTEVSAVDQKLAQIKSGAQKRFEALKLDTLKLVEKVKNITITDEITLAMATQTLGTANAQEKLVEMKRKELKAPYLQGGKLIDSVADEVLKPLEEALAIGREKLKIWNDAQSKIQSDKSAALELVKERLTKIEDQLKEKFQTVATNAEKCQKLIDSIEKIYPPFDTYAPFQEEAKSIKARYIQMLTEKKHAYENGNPGAISSLAANVLEGSTRAMAAIESKQVMQSMAITDTTVKSATRKTWKFEIIDENAILREWLTPDEKKIRAYMDLCKMTMKSGTILNGVKFYQEETLIIR